MIVWAFILSSVLQTLAHVSHVNVWCSFSWFSISSFDSLSKLQFGHVILMTGFNGVWDGIAFVLLVTWRMDPDPGEGGLVLSSRNFLASNAIMDGFLVKHIEQKYLWFPLKISPLSSCLVLEHSKCS